MINILLCDDHAVVRMGLTMLLNNHPEMEVIGEASEGNEAIQKAQEKGKTVIYVGFSHQESRALVDSCKETQTLTKDQLQPFVKAKAA